jgi:manganese/iron transport system substrate-binding protein
VSDPHVWFDPGNVQVWVRNVDTALSTLDPGHAAQYHANAQRYAAELSQLDATIQQQVGQVPPERRKLVTDHDALGYYAARYGFRVIGTVIPSISTTSEPSARDLADLIGKIRAEQVPAVFIGSTLNPKLAETVARETGARVYPLYTGALGAPGSGADTYLGMMETNTQTIVRGLGGQ